MFDDPPIRAILLRRALGLAAAGFLLAGASAAAREQAAPAQAKITFTKVLKGSQPEYLSISVDSAGVAAYDGRKLDDPPAPRTLRLTDATTRRIFDLAAALGNFEDGDLESYKKVANLGKKTLAYDDGAKNHQAQFNYTRRREAQDLTDIFEKISAVAQHIATLEYSIKYDHLSLPAQLRQIQSDLERRALTDPELLAPTLEKIANNPRFLHLAQSRAQNILGRLHNGE